MHPNGELIRAGYEAFAKGDVESVANLLADDVEWHEAGTSRLSGDFTGKDAVLAYFGTLMDVTQGTFAQEIHDIVANDDHVVVMVNAGFSRPREFTTGAVHVWHLADGKATACWAVPLDQAGSAAALA